MKNLAAAILVLLLLAFTAPFSHAYTPPLPLPLEKRVGMSTHVFVGEIQEINYVDATGKVITPEEAYASYPHLTARWKIKVHEVLFPAKWGAGGIADFQEPYYIPYSSSLDSKAERLNRTKDSLSGTRNFYIGKKYIFLTRATNPTKKKVYLISAQDQYYHEDLKQKAKIQSIIKNALAKKKSKKSPKKTTTTR